MLVPVPVLKRITDFSSLIGKKLSTSIYCHVRDILDERTQIWHFVSSTNNHHLLWNLGGVTLLLLWDTTLKKCITSKEGIEGEFRKNHVQLVSRTGQKFATMHISLVGQPFVSQLKRGTTFLNISSPYASYTTKSMGILEWQVTTYSSQTLSLRQNRPVRDRKCPVRDNHSQISLNILIFFLQHQLIQPLGMVEN